MKTKVVNKRRDYYDVDISRSSRWGNPFSHMGNSYAAVIVDSREASIECYRKWLNGELIVENWPYKPPSKTEIVTKLRGKILGCYCKKKSCHGDILKEIADATT